MTSNWDKLKQKLTISKRQKVDSKIVTKDRSEVDEPLKKRRNEITDSLNSKKVQESQLTSIDVLDSRKEPPNIRILKKYRVQSHKYVALDCEMVGIGLSGKQSALARCSMVDFDGNEIYDKFVRPPAFVTDFRTQWSGVRKRDLRSDNAITLLECQDEVAAILKDKILVGHALKNDLNVLMLKHSKSMIRDTATYQPYMRPHPKKRGKFKPRALRDLSKQFLNKIIQTGEHDSCEDARVALQLYQLKQDEWEKSIIERRKLIRLKATGKLDNVLVESKDNISADSTAATKADPTISSSNKRSSMFGNLDNTSLISINDADKKFKKIRHQ